MGSARIQKHVHTVSSSSLLILFLTDLDFALY